MDRSEFTEPDEHGYRYWTGGNAEDPKLAVAPMGGAFQIAEPGFISDHWVPLPGMYRDLETAKDQLLKIVEHRRQEATLGRYKTSDVHDSPWGPVQHAMAFAPGITFVSTASHGGFKVEDDWNRAIPEPMRKNSGWYEEDQEANLVVLGHPHVFTDLEIEEAHQSVRNWYPDVYENVYNVKLGENDSFKRAQEAFYARHADDLVGVSAIMEDGGETVQVTAVPGGDRRHLRTDEERTFRVAKSEYDQRSQFGFIPKPDVHEEITPAPAPGM